MRIGLILAGILLAAIGVAAFTGQLNFKQDKEVVKIGSLSASVKEDKTVPQWLGGVAVLVGIGLVVSGAMRK
jgi:predicted hotdog family 3-hydroxylacyl-ACP dehydratase